MERNHLLLTPYTFSAYSKLSSFLEKYPTKITTCDDYIPYIPLEHYSPPQIIELDTILSHLIIAVLAQDPILLMKELKQINSLLAAYSHLMSPNELIMTRLQFLFSRTTQITFMQMSAGMSEIPCLETFLPPIFKESLVAGMICAIILHHIYQKYAIAQLAKNFPRLRVQYHYIKSLLKPIDKEYTDSLAKRKNLALMIRSFQDQNFLSRCNNISTILAHWYNHRAISSYLIRLVDAHTQIGRLAIFFSITKPYVPTIELADNDELLVLMRSQFKSINIILLFSIFPYLICKELNPIKIPYTGDNIGPKSFSMITLHYLTAQKRITEKIYQACADLTPHQVIFQGSLEQIQGQCNDTLLECGKIIAILLHHKKISHLKDNIRLWEEQKTVNVFHRIGAQLQAPYNSWQKIEELGTVFKQVHLDMKPMIMRISNAYYGILPITEQDKKNSSPLVEMHDFIFIDIRHGQLLFLSRYNFQHIIREYFDLLIWPRHDISKKLSTFSQETRNLSLNLDNNFVVKKTTLNHDEHEEVYYTLSQNDRVIGRYSSIAETQRQLRNRCCWNTDSCRIGEAVSLPTEMAIKNIWISFLSIKKFQFLPEDWQKSEQLLQNNLYGCAIVHTPHGRKSAHAGYTTQSHELLQLEHALPNSSELYIRLWLCLSRIMQNAPDTLAHISAKESLRIEMETTQVNAQIMNNCITELILEWNNYHTSETWKACNARKYLQETLHELRYSMCTEDGQELLQDI